LFDRDDETRECKGDSSWEPQYRFLGQALVPTPDDVVLIMNPMVRNYTLSAGTRWLFRNEETDRILTQTLTAVRFGLPVRGPEKPGHRLVRKLTQKMGHELALVMGTSQTRMLKADPREVANGLHIGSVDLAHKLAARVSLQLGVEDDGVTFVFRHPKAESFDIWPKSVRAILKTVNLLVEGAQDKNMYWPSFEAVMQEACHNLARWYAEVKLQEQGGVLDTRPSPASKPLLKTLDRPQAEKNRAL